MGAPMMAALLAGLAILLVFIGIVRLLSRDAEIATRLGEFGFFGPATSARMPVSKQGPLMNQMDRIVANRNFTANVARDLARANLKLTVSEYVVVHLLAISFGYLLAYALARNAGFALLGALLGFYGPSWYVHRRHSMRLNAFNGQLADTISMLANSLRSGYSLLQSMDLVAREAANPTREEFSRVVREVSLGLSPEEALGNLVRRIDSDDLDLLVTAINVQREVGGNLAQILDTIGTTIRERVRIKGEIKVLTAQQTISGYVISLLPIALGLVLFLINQKYVMQLFSFEQFICMPVIAMPICGAVMMILGFIVIKRIVAIEV